MRPDLPTASCCGWLVWRRSIAQRQIALIVPTAAPLFKSVNPVDGSTIHPYYPAFLPRAQMAELVDALRSGRSDRKVVEVRVLFWAPGIPINHCFYLIYLGIFVSGHLSVHPDFHATMFRYVAR